MADQVSPLLQPKPFTVAGQDGRERTYILSKFPAVAGREIIAKYPLSAVPKLGEYSVNEETMFKLMAYVGVDIDGKTMKLVTRALIDNHVPDWETLAKIELEMMRYNTSFFLQGEASTFLKIIADRATQLITQTVTDSLRPSSLTVKPPSMN